MIETKKYIYKNNKYIEMCTKIYPSIYIYQPKNVQIHRNVCRKTFM